jgi:hypothetical protein
MLMHATMRALAIRYVLTGRANLSVATTELHALRPIPAPTFRPIRQTVEHVVKHVINHRRALQEAVKTDVLEIRQTIVMAIA